MEENGGALPCLGSKVVPCTLGEGLIVLPPRRGDVWEHSLAALLGVSQVGQDCCISVAAIGRPLLVEEIVPMGVVLQGGGTSELSTARKKPFGKQMSQRNPDVV